MIKENSRESEYSDLSTGDTNNFLWSFLFILSLFSTNIASLFCFYIGLHSVPLIKSIVSLLLEISFFIFDCVFIFKYYKGKNYSFSQALLFSIPIILMIFACVCAIFQNNGYGCYYLLIFGCTCIPAYYMAFILPDFSNWMWRRMLIKGLDLYTLYTLPFIIICLIFIFSPLNKEGLLRFGLFTYLDVAYFIYPIICYQYIKIIFIPVKYYGLNILLILVCYFLIYATGTKSAILFTLISFGLVVIIKGIFFNLKGVFRGILLIFACFSIILLFKYIIPLKQMAYANWRANNFIEGMLNNTFESQPVYFSKDEALKISELQSQAKYRGELNLETSLMDFIKPRPAYELEGFYLGRKTLYELSLYEILENPLIGLGPFGFIYKYFGYYTHNLFLDFLTDYGLPISILIFGFFIIGTRLILKYNKRKNSVFFSMLLIFIVSLLLPNFIKGYYAYCIPFWFYAGLCTNAMYNTHIHKKQTRRLQNTA